MKNRVLPALGVLALVTALTGCGQLFGTQAEENPGAAALAGYSIESFRGSNVTNEDGVITVRRGAEGSQGVVIRPATMMLHFTVEGEGAMLRVHQRGQVGYIPLQANNSVLVGQGGASQLLFFTRTGDEVIVRVIGATDCTNGDPAVCVPATIQPVEQSEPATDSQQETPAQIRE